MGTTIVSIHIHDKDSILIEAHNKGDVLKVICKGDYIFFRLFKIQIRMWWKALTKFTKNAV